MKGVLVGGALWIFRRKVSRFEKSIALRENGFDAPGGVCVVCSATGAGLGVRAVGLLIETEAFGAGFGVRNKPAKNAMGMSSQGRMGELIAAARVVGKPSGRPRSGFRVVGNRQRGGG